MPMQSYGGKTFGVDLTPPPPPVLEGIVPVILAC